jgi:hypothetical protein
MVKGAEVVEFPPPPQPDKVVVAKRAIKQENT